MHVRYTPLIQCLGFTILLCLVPTDASPTLHSDTSPPFWQHLPLLGRSAQETAVCCLPVQWEATVFDDWASANSVLGVMYRNSSIDTGFSIPDQKFYLYLEWWVWWLDVVAGSGIDIELDDYIKGISYRVMKVRNSNDGDCQIGGTSGNLTLPCIPGNATLLSRGGFGDKHLPVSTYSFGGVIATVYIDDTVEPRQCRPVHFWKYDLVEGGGDLWSNSVMDLGPVRSPHIFDIPKDCRNTTLRDTIEPRQCRPVHFWKYDLVEGGGDLWSNSVMDLGPVRSPHIFEIPKDCRNTTLRG